MHFIDAHVHVWTPDTGHYPLAEGFKKSDMKPPSFTPEDLFKHTKPAGVDRVNLIQMSYYGFEKPYTIHPDMAQRPSFQGCKTWLRQHLDARTAIFVSVRPNRRRAGA